MEEFLIRAELGHLVQTFTDQNVTMDLIKNLNEELLKELVPLVGDRIRFMRALNDFVVTQDSSNYSEAASKCGIVEAEEPKEKKQKLDSPVVLYVEEPFYKETLESSKSNESESFTSSSTVTVVSDEFASPINFSKISGIAYCENFCEHSSNLEKLLQSDCIGRTILSKYLKQQNLDNKDRNYICEIIISHFFNAADGKLNNHCLSKIADQITALFPNEQKSCYYVGPITKRQSPLNRPEVARGKLVDKHRNKVTALKKLKSQFQEETVSSQIVIQEESQSTRESKIWLMKNFEPKDDVIEHWKNSYPLRSLPSTKNISIDEIFKEWPVLQTQLAPELVSIDFEKQFNIESCHMEENFESFFKKLLETRRKSLSASDETFLSLLDEEITADSRNAIRLFLVASLVPPKGRTRCAGKVQWKPSVSEARDGFFIHVKTPGDVEEAKKNRIDFMYRKGFTVQPYIILIGSSLTNVINSFVVIDNYTYNCSSVISALDFCFKAHHVFDAKYSYECQHIWYLIQWHMYNLKTKSDIHIPFISDIKM